MINCHPVSEATKSWLIFTRILLINSLKSDKSPNIIHDVSGKYLLGFLRQPNLQLERSGRKQSPQSLRLLPIVAMITVKADLISLSSL